jgi:hypothetical protein
LSRHCSNTKDTKGHEGSEPWIFFMLAERTLSTAKGARDGECF